MAQNTKKYFEGVDTLEDLKVMYHTYVNMYHPDKHRKDKDTYTEIMATINAEYTKVFKKVKNNHKGYDKYKKQYYNYTKDTEEKVEEFRDVINALISLKGFKKDLTIELLGNWIWVSGNTKRYKDELSELGLHYAPQKQAWEFHTGKYARKSRPTGDMDHLRNKYGSVEFESTQLALGM